MAHYAKLYANWQTGLSQYGPTLGGAMNPRVDGAAMLQAILEATGGAHGNGRSGHGRRPLISGRCAYVIACPTAREAALCCAVRVTRVSMPYVQTVVLVGAGGHGKVTLEAMRASGPEADPEV